MEQAKVSAIIELARLNKAIGYEKIFKELGKLPGLTCLLSKRELTELPGKTNRVDPIAEVFIRKNRLTSLPDIIEHLTSLNVLDLRHKLVSLPDSIGHFVGLNALDIRHNNLTELPDGISNSVNLNDLDLQGNQLTNLPDNIGNLANLKSLNLVENCLTNLPDSIGNLINLESLDLQGNQLTRLPGAIYKLSKLDHLDISDNQIATLPDALEYLPRLRSLILNDNPLTDLSLLQRIPNLESVRYRRVNLPCRYWIRFDEWKSEWLISEGNAEIKRTLIEHVGYDRICKDLSADNLDTWREYTLLKIDGVEARLDPSDISDTVYSLPMVLLKMTCPSTGHTHILRVPPETKSAEAAITWVNHDIHPDRFAAQT